MLILSIGGVLSPFAKDRMLSNRAGSCGSLILEGKPRSRLPGPQGGEGGKFKVASEVSADMETHGIAEVLLDDARNAIA